MKRIIFIITALFVSLGLAVADASAQKKQETVFFETSIHCANCQAKIEDNLPFEKGVKDVKVDVENKIITIVFDPEKTDIETLRKAIEALGYSAEVYSPFSESDNEYDISIMVVE